MNFIQGVLSGDTGQGSTQRICLLMIIIMLLAWTTRIVLLSQTIPVIPDTWVYIIGVFITGITGGKAVDAYRTVKTTPTDTPQ